MKKAHGNKTGGDCSSGFKCSKCDQKFLSRVHLKHHEKAKQEEKKCEDCGFKSCTHVGFLNHMKKAHGKKLEQSNLKDSNLRNLNENFSKREKASISKPYNCTKCDYKTHSKPNLNVHMKSKDEPTVFENCDFKSCTKMGLRIHFRNIHDHNSGSIKKVSNLQNEAVFCCNFCGYKARH